MGTVRSLFLRLGSNRQGGTAIIFGLSLAVLCGFVGFALDFSRSASTKQTAQSVIDSAMLAASRQSTIDDLGVENLIAAYFSRPDTIKHGAQLLSSKGAVKNGGELLEGEVVLRVPTTLLNVIGQTHFDLKIESKVMRGLGNVEIALVLDTTKSMSIGSRMANAKAAATSLVDTIYALPDASSKIKVALVPFAEYVNVGMEHRSASWMNVPADSVVTTTTHQCWDTYPNATSSNCRTVTYTAYDDGVPYTYSYEECDWVYGDPVAVCDWVTNTTSQTWYGCAGARSYPLNVKDEQYSTQIPGVMNASCAGKLLPLTNDPTEIKASIESMTPYGQTYIPTGIVWGWRVLSNRQPFTQSADDPATASGSVRKYIVLMTDGENQRGPNYTTGAHNDTGGAAITTANNLTKEACDNIKADGESKIDIFTIAFEVTDESIKDILRYCATPGGAFFDAVDYSKLLTAFSEIGSNVSVARLAK